MHTINMPEHGVVIHFNSDFSGDACIVDLKTLNELVIPCAALLEFNNRVQVMEIQRAFEDLSITPSSDRTSYAVRSKLLRAHTVE